MAGYVSEFLSHVPVVEAHRHDLIAPAGMAHGLIPRDYALHPYGSIPHAGPATLKKISRDEWDDRIAEMDRDKSSLWHLMDHMKSPVKYQNGISYCWSHGICRAVEVRSMSQNGKLINLSATSVGCKIKNFRNVGGWGRDAIEYASEHGFCTAEDWPENKLDPRYDTPAAWANAKNHRVIEWDELEENDFDMAMSYALERMPFGLGLDWWRHLICGMVPIAFGNKKYGLGIDNSHGTSYGDRGRGILPENKARGDACAPRTIQSASLGA